MKINLKRDSIVKNVLVIIIAVAVAIINIRLIMKAEHLPQK
jgi:hypothetical protein